MNPLKGRLISRLVAAVIVSIPAAFLLAHVEQRKLEAWAQDPSAAQAVQLHVTGVVASFGGALIALVIWLLIFTLCIEGVSCLIRGDWDRSGDGKQST